MRRLLLAILFITQCNSAYSQMFQQFSGSVGKSPAEFDALKKELGQVTINNAMIARLDDRVLLDPRIVGGVPVEITADPWQLALVFGVYKEPLRAQFCGASLIADRWAVTAAHCVSGDPVKNNPANVDVIANTSFYNTGGNRIAVTQIIVHEKYDAKMLENDIALLHLASTTAVLRPVHLPNVGDPLIDGTKLIVTGWGALREGGIGSAYLIGANIPVVSNDICNKAESYNGEVTAQMICAGEREGGLDACQGDSGGPAVAIAANGPVLMGITSFGEGCARRFKYGVYTNVRSYRNWIKEKIGE